MAAENIRLGYLFRDNPPRDKELTHKLFCNREKQLKFGLRLLGSGESFGQICAVHGKTRSGKSHLVQELLLLAEQKGLPYLIFAVNANNRGTARAVLEEVFCEFWKKLEALKAGPLPEGADGLGTEGHYAQVMSYLEQKKLLVENEFSDLSFEQSRSSGTVVEGGLKIRVPYIPIAEAGPTHKTEKREADTERQTARTPSDRDLIEWLRYEVDALAQFYPGHKVLLFIDDLDLLDQCGAEGQTECNRLVHLLKALAEHPAAVVLVTFRHVFFNGREKEFFDFIEVGLMKDDQLLEVYERHIQTFNGGEPVFDEQALQWIFLGSEGKVGIFLHTLYVVWRHVNPDPGGLIRLADVKDFVRLKIMEFRNDPTHFPILAAIEKAVLDGQVQVRIEEDLKDTEVLFWVLTPLPGRPQEYRINPLYVQVLREERCSPSGLLFHEAMPFAVAPPSTSCR